MEILEIEILTDDMDKTELFYSAVIGLPIADRKEDTISFSAGRSLLTFHRSVNKKPKYHFAFNIPHNKIDEAVKWAGDRVKLIKNENNSLVNDFESWNAKAIYFYDNNQNILEFIARFDLENISDKPFNSSSILSISEMGIVTDHPLSMADKLSRENKIGYFSKNQKKEDFVVLGDDNGLLIIVGKHRNWYPTDHPSEDHYYKLRLMVDGVEREVVFE